MSDFVAVFTAGERFVTLAADGRPRMWVVSADGIPRDPHPDYTRSYPEVEKRD